METAVERNNQTRRIKTFIRRLMQGLHQNFTNNEQPKAHGPQRLTECTAMKAIFSQNIVNVACKKNTFRLAWQLIKFSSLDIIHMVVGGLFKEYYCKAFVKIPKVR